MNTALELPEITNEQWVLRCTDTAQRDEMLAYAASKGVPVYKKSLTRPNALSLGWCLDLMAYSGEGDESNEGQVTPEQFRAMCDVYPTIL